jgi:hypothetical protein
LILFLSFKIKKSSLKIQNSRTDYVSKEEKTDEQESILQKTIPLNL